MEKEEVIHRLKEAQEQYSLEKPLTEKQKRALIWQHRPWERIWDIAIHSLKEPLDPPSIRNKLWNILKHWKETGNNTFEPADFELSRSSLAQLCELKVLELTEPGIYRLRSLKDWETIIKGYGKLDHWLLPVLRDDPRLNNADRMVFLFLVDRIYGRKGNPLSRTMPTREWKLFGLDKQHKHRHMQKLQSTGYIKYKGSWVDLISLNTLFGLPVEQNDEEQKEY